MTDALDALLRVAADHRGWAGPAFGLLAFGESLALAGTFIPATPALFLIGSLLGGGQVDPLVTVPWMLAGAIGGYWASWAIGRRMGARIYRMRPFAAHRRGVARARLFFRRWGGPALVIGRFVLGPFQSLLPLVAGVAGMRGRRFHAWNLASSIAWVGVVLTPGFLAARGVTLFGFGLREQRLLVGALLAVSVTMVAGALVTAVVRVNKPNRHKSVDM